MSNLLLSLPDLYNSYKTWILKNPQSASDYETAAKYLSYFIAGRINNSHIASELVYSLSNLLVLFNDRIISKNKQHSKNSLQVKPQNRTAEKLTLYLTIIEYAEVFCELSAKKIWGKTGRWIVIVGIQVFKCLARLLLIYEHKEPIIQTPPISPLDRNQMCKEEDHRNGMIVNGSKASLDLPHSELGAVYFTLKRSGRVVRKVESSPPIGYRSWKPLTKRETILNTVEKREALEQPLTGRSLLAETVYVVKPLAHLVSVGLFGEDTWKPWILSLLMDVSSLHLYKSVQSKSMDSLTTNQKLQLSRRTVALLLYLIRSPVYEKYTGNKINALLLSIGRNVPLAKIICSPLAQYLPFWQSCYFYMWCT